jgi:hypothetical protein
MSNYKCTHGFKSVSGRTFTNGQKISDSEYNRVSSLERRNFQEIKETRSDSSRSSSSDPNSFANFNVPSFDFGGSSSSSNSGNDTSFGGGSFGGGGASGDW